ncbi:hypothetical protein D1872_315800 [compost metagenome]
MPKESAVTGLSGTADFCVLYSPGLSIRSDRSSVNSNRGRFCSAGLQKMEMGLTYIQRISMHGMMKSRAVRGNEGQDIFNFKHK